MDEGLVSRARAGDRTAMEQLLRSVAPSIRRFALRMCKNDADADDVLQDALWKIATHLGEFEGRSSVPSWAFALTRSACARRRRGRKNEPHHDAGVLVTEPATDAGPEDRVAHGELSRLVASAMDRLSEEHREVLLLRDVEGLTAAEAAVVLGTAVPALKSRLHRARAALREALRPVLEPQLPASAACPDVVRALSQKLEGELDARACEAMEAHVAACASCAATCDAVKDALRACRSAAATPLGPDIEASVRSTIARWLDPRT